MKLDETFLIKANLIQQVYDRIQWLFATKQATIVVYVLLGFQDIFWICEDFSRFFRLDFRFLGFMGIFGGFY